MRQKFTGDVSYVFIIITIIYFPSPLLMYSKYKKWGSQKKKTLKIYDSSSIPLAKSIAV